MKRICIAGTLAFLFVFGSRAFAANNLAITAGTEANDTYDFGSSWTYSCSATTGCPSAGHCQSADDTCTFENEAGHLVTTMTFDFGPKSPGGCTADGVIFASCSVDTSDPNHQKIIFTKGNAGTGIAVGDVVVISYSDQQSTAVVN